MALVKQDININFGQGLDTKTDPFQVQPGKFLSLNNSVFTKAHQLTKRNGFSLLGDLPVTNTTLLTTFNGNLTAIGTELNAYSNGTWTNSGSLYPISLNTISLVKNNLNQSQASSVTASNGNVCVVYTSDPASGGSTTYNYAVLNGNTGQYLISPTVISAAAATPKVYFLNPYFIILYPTNPGLSYVAISSTALTVGNPTIVSSTQNPASANNYDATVVNKNLYITFANGSNIDLLYLTNYLHLSNFVTTSGTANVINVISDTTLSTPVLYINYYTTGSTSINVLCYDDNLNPITGFPTSYTTPTGVANIAATAQNNQMTSIYEIQHSFTPPGGLLVKSNNLYKAVISGSGSTVSNSLIIKGLGLASKGFLINSTMYFLTVFSSQNQPSYFLLDQNANTISKLAYSNGPYNQSNTDSYYHNGLPEASISNNTVTISYLLADLIQSTNKVTNGTSLSAVYTQTGVSNASFNFTPQALSSTEIGSNLEISGGFVWGYDGVKPTEQGFFLWPDNVQVTSTSTGGSIGADTYYYQVVYEWTDNQGNVYKSAPSIPISVTTTGSTSAVTLNIQTLKVSYKTNIRITVYRWSISQEVYYQVTSMISPTLNNPTVDYITYVDTQANSSIIGNEIIYTTGGVLEDIAAPSTDVMTLFNDRLWLVDSEDRNLLWYSKQIIEATPVEMSDLLTIYVAPSIGAQGSTGPITALAPLDDKLIVFKKDAIYYINGTGPDNTGANSAYSDPIFISSVVGCSVQNSIVFIPNGLMFQSDKGIWLLNRDLGTSYIGAPVESYTQGALVKSALNIPGTNQVRFTMDSGVTLMYDYYFQQWGTFTNIPAVSSTLYGSLHTYVDKYGRAFQETPGSYLDNTSPVLMSFTTSWMSLAGLQGYERFYQMLLLGVAITPFKLNVQIGYDYNSGMSENHIVTPDSFQPAWGGLSTWGAQGPWGGNSNAFKARVFPSTQKVESFQLVVNELYDPSYGIAAGAGLTLSGIDLTVGIKKGRRTSSASRSF